MNSVKLIALDIDGTLYNKDGVITSYNKEMIRKAVENGITVIISTGRPYIGLPVASNMPLLPTVLRYTASRKRNCS